jgi:uncharacterized protein involved in exopolysaccharide biosynthesis
LRRPDLEAPDLVARLLLFRRAIVRSVVLVTALTGIALWLRPARWTATGSFVVQSGGGESLGQLAGLASQFGVNIGGTVGGYPPRFFAALMTSDQTLEAVLDGALGGRADTAQLRGVARTLDVKGDTPAELRERVIRKLRRDVIGAIYDQRTGITTFQVRTESRDLSARVAAALVGELDRFNGERHRSRASSERRFLQTQRDLAAAELLAAERRLVDFLSRNREFEGSPEQSLRYERLKRRAGELETNLSALSRSYEQARIEEVRDTPVITLVDAPRVSAIPDERSIGSGTVAAAIATLLLGVGAVLALQLIGAIPDRREGAPARTAGALRALAKDLRRPWRLLVG